MMMHLGEIETAGRHGVALLITVFNDGAYGAELHKLRAQGLDVAPSLHGDVDLAAVARAFGLEGARIQDLQGLDELLARYVRSQAPMLWDIKIADTVPAPQYRF
jgi:thiamine pyrophosphate-dependent acetolactate synthase large subunit-like protein